MSVQKHQCEGTDQQMEQEEQEGCAATLCFPPSRQCCRNPLVPLVPFVGRPLARNLLIIN